MRTICVVTGTRAEYGLMRWLMRELQADGEFRLQVIATGAHLSPEFGLTAREIEADGIKIDRSVEMLLSSDTAVGIAKSMGLGMIGFADALHEMHPDLVVVLGDRFELLSVVSAALVARIPVAHLHGGEATEGAFDESIRHAITKMSHVHFVAAEPYRRRVIQLGEDPARVFTVGGLGLDNIRRVPLLPRAELEQALDFSFGQRSLMITFHPATLDGTSSSTQMTELLAALDGLADTQLLFTMPNADTESRSLIALIEGFVASHANARAYTSLGTQKYLSCIAQVDGVVGNSSSGLLEVPSFRKGTINVGDRQGGRLKAASVIDCDPTAASIGAALQTLYSPTFQTSLASVENPYGTGGASAEIVRILRTLPLDGLIKKTFHDLSVDSGE